MEPPSRPTQQDRDRFFAAIGQAISEWANVEIELFYLSKIAIGCAEKYAAIVFYRTPTMESRLALTGDVIEATYPPIAAGAHHHPEIVAWRALIKDIRDGMEMRNRLAHHHVGFVLDVWEKGTGGKIVSYVRQGVYISPTERPDRKQKDKIIEPKDVELHIAEIGKLINRLRDFRDL
jgi:hypothetical protein